MKGIYNTVRWTLGQVRPFIRSFIFLILLGAVLSLCDVAIAVISKRLIDGAVLGELSVAFNAGIIFAAVIVLQIILQSILSVSSLKLEEIMSNNIRKKVFSQIIKAEWKELSKYHSGDLLTRMTRDIGIFSNTIINTVLDIVSLGVQMLAAFIVLLIFEPILAVAAVVISPVALLISRVFRRKMKKVYTRMQETEGEYRSFIHEAVQNLSVIKAFCMEKRNIQKLDGLHAENLGWVKKRSKISAATNSVLSLGYWAGYFMSFSFGAYRLYQGKATFGTFAAFIQLFGQVQEPLEGLAYKVPQIISAEASAERLMEFDRLSIEDDVIGEPAWTSAGIVFENVRFKYGEANNILEDVSFEIYPGEATAIIGTSGEGKTTIIRLLLSLIKPEAGRISFVNQKNERIESGTGCRGMISYVPQGNTLFSGTIRENLYLGNPDASEEGLKKALEKACAWDFICELPDGLDTEVGERGIGLSEGQAQRIAIARAFLHKAPILVLDEATSALDVNTEVEVLKAIKTLKHQPTCIIVSHRPSVIKMCSKILRLEDGRILECEDRVISAPEGEAV